MNNEKSQRASSIWDLQASPGSTKFKANNLSRKELLKILREGRKLIKRRSNHRCTRKSSKRI